MTLFSKFKKNKKPEVKKVKKPEEKKESPKRIINKGAVEAYFFLKGPHITEKAANLAEKSKYIFKVKPKANKIEVQRAIEGLYRVKVAKVNMVHIAPKKRRLGQTEGWKGGLKKGYKKAVVTLMPGEKIELSPR